LQQNQLKPLTGKVAIVTGAGRGLGRAEALALAAAGASVVVNDLGGGLFGQAAAAEVAESVAKEIRDAGGAAVANGDSVAEMDGGRRLIAAALAAYGRLDILVNNAGIVRPKPIWEMSEEDWDLVNAVHLKGHFTTVRHAAPLFREQRSGIIINTASESGLGHYGMSNYSAVKEGIVGFTRAIARDLGQFGVRCNAIRPRALTRMAVPEVFETLRMSQEVLGFAVHGNRWVGMDEDNPPEHVGAFVAWLCTDSAQRANGQTFFVGGGTVGLYSDPELERSMYRPDGWSIQELSKTAVREHLLDGVENRFRGRDFHEKAKK
jgi:3-oxoacyl-[acyl-carrier protein] reductase